MEIYRVGKVLFDRSARLDGTTETRGVLRGPRGPKKSIIVNPYDVWLQSKQS